MIEINDAVKIYGDFTVYGLRLSEREIIIDEDALNALSGGNCGV